MADFIASLSPQAWLLYEIWIALAAIVAAITIGLIFGLRSRFHMPFTAWLKTETLRLRNRYLERLLKRKRRAFPRAGFFKRLRHHCKRAARRLTRAPTEADETVVVRNPAFYWLVLFGLAALYFIVGGAIALFVQHTNAYVSVFGWNYNAGVLLWELGIAHYIFGFRYIRANEIAGVYALQSPTIVVSSFFVCVPFGVFQLIKFTTLTNEIELPAEPELIFRGDGAVPDGMRPPFRITFAEDATDPDDPLKRRVTQEVPYILRIRIEDPFTFYRRIGSLKEAERQLEDIGASYLAETLPHVTLDEAIRNVATHSKRLQDLTQAWSVGTGAKVPTARIKELVLSHELNKKIQTIAETVADKKTAIIKSEGERTKRRNEGMGDGLADAARLIGHARGVGAIAGVLKDNPSGELALAAETARDIGGHGNTTIVQGFEGLMGAAAAAAAALKNKVPPVATPAPAPASPTVTS